MSKKGIALYLAVFFIWIGTAASSEQESPKRIVSERLITQIDYSSWILDSLIVSPDNKHIACVIKKGNEWFVVRDGEKEGPYEGIKKFIPIFSPDSKHLAYVVTKSKIREFVVIDGKQNEQFAHIGNIFIRTKNSQKFDEIFADGPIFSSDSKRLAYVASRYKRTFVVVDGKKGKEYDAIFDLAFIPNSNQLVYRAKEDNKQFVVINGQEQKRYDHIGLGTISFSPDGRRIGYAATVDNKWFAVIDENEGPTYDGILDVPFLFSPDGKHLAYAAISDKESSQQKRLLQFDEKPIMSGKHLVFETISDRKSFFVKDGEPQKQYDYVCFPKFSPDGNRFAYAAKLGSKWVVVVDGKEGKKYDGIIEEGLNFSPDSQHITYGAVIGDKFFVAVNGEEGKRYDGIIEGSLSFSPDSKHIAYGAGIGDKKFVVVYGKEGKKYDALYPTPVFSPDSKHVAYGAGIGDHYFLVVDGQVGKEWDDFVTIGGGRIVFDSPDRLYYFAIKDNGIYLVEERIE